MTKMNILHKPENKTEEVQEASPEERALMIIYVNTYTISKLLFEIESKIDSYSQAEKEQYASLIAFLSSKLHRIESCIRVEKDVMEPLYIDTLIERNSKYVHFNTSVEGKFIGDDRT